LWRGRRVPVRLSLFGAAGDNSNLGVRALMTSVVAGIRRREPSADITVFDNGFGVGKETVRSASGDIQFRRCGARLSRRYHRPESYWQMRAALRTFPRVNRGTSLLMRSDAVLDITGGDSFTDVYGLRRFASSLAPKRLALDAGRTLVLLPQAYGPFRSRESRARAAQVLRQASAAWARDEISFECLRELLGSSYDPERHRQGVDVAFGLETLKPPPALAEEVLQFVHRHEGRPLVGLNVSGLLYNDPDANSRFGLGVDYRALYSSLLGRLLDEAGACVILVNHVLAPTGTIEADRVASAALVAEIRPAERDRLLVVSDPPGPGEAKWCISQCEWFVGSRMHATIAALSSGVPAAAVAYTHKAAGVFASCGLEDDVADARGDPRAVLPTLWNSFERRNERRATLAEKLPEVISRASSQLDDILEECRHPAGGTADR
jgi:colanic acid/amylovoran biosynthesis protein